MTLIRLYAWSCVVALPIVLGLGIVYLYIDDRIGFATTLVVTFALACVCVTAAVLRDRDEEDASATEASALRRRS